MIHLFTIIFYQPILSLLIFLYNTVSFHDIGIAIILLTIIIRLILWPLSRKSIKSQRELQELQPKLEELKKKITNREEQARATMALYKEHKINPFSSCLPLLIQLPFLIAVYQVFRDGLGNRLNLVYPFIYKPEFINTVSFGFLDLAKSNLPLAVLAGLAQFWQGKMMFAKNKKLNKGADAIVVKDESMTTIMNKQMIYMMPVLTIFIGATLPGGLTLYWLVITLLTALQQFIVLKSFKKDKKLESGVIEGELINK
ncbi:MAG: YidC/Oxa1 family membrane protein insertase [Candidatus Falkowbacteria bacterium]|nr:YidC/Oxa1 family membrane protein insertase [Candidatus Falkowbacteria bacterium]